ncbi:MAG TPA: hypothetical protein VJO33_01980 [Gemmatimonadaceae bacterium]|nr:hypothetical protein [Gemmatimonadaceae bacterium]
MLAYADGDARIALGNQPSLDVDASLQLATSLFAGEKLAQLGPGDLSYTCPPDDEINVGRFQGVAVVAAKEFGIDYPSALPKRFLELAPFGKVYLHAMHSVVDWFAFAQCEGGKLVRSLNVSPDSGIMEDFGSRFPFEEPYWSGQHPALDPEEDPSSYPFPFHPLELAEAALRAMFGYQLEGYIDDSLLEPESIALIRLKRSRSRWKFWR